MGRYLNASDHNTVKAMTLYRKNLKLSHELFTIISCFEVTLRNAIDRYLLIHLGPDWLRKAVAKGGIFDNAQCKMTAIAIKDILQLLGNQYSHNKLVASLGFGFWRYLFSRHQYRATGQHLLNVFVAKPPNSTFVQHNALFIFNQLAQVNKIRNRIAHHEPICFQTILPVKDTSYVRSQYDLILKLFKWLAVDEHALLYGLDHIERICDEIDEL
jgi:hypothetical protein